MVCLSSGWCDLTTAIKHLEGLNLEEDKDDDDKIDLIEETIFPKLGRAKAAAQDYDPQVTVLALAHRANIQYKFYGKP